MTSSKSIRRLLSGLLFEQKNNRKRLSAAFTATEGATAITRKIGGTFGIISILLYRISEEESRIDLLEVRTQQTI